MSESIMEIGAALAQVKRELANFGEAKWARQYMSRDVAMDIAHDAIATVLDTPNCWIFLPKFSGKSVDASPQPKAASQPGIMNSDGCMNAVPQFVTTGYAHMGQAGPQTEASTVVADFERNCNLAGQAGETVSKGIESTLSERGQRYGAFDIHASITQNLKRAMVDSPKWERLPDDMKEALEMIQHKIGRILNGDPLYADSWVDIEGYAHLVSKRLEQK